MEKYPEFVPWCVSTRKVERFLSDEDQQFVESGGIVASHSVSYIEMSAGFKALHDSYISRVSSIKNVSVKVKFWGLSYA